MLELRLVLVYATAKRRRVVAIFIKVAYKTSCLLLFDKICLGEPRSGMQQWRRPTGLDQVGGRAACGANFFPCSDFHALLYPPAPSPCAIHLDYGSLTDDFAHMLALMGDGNSGSPRDSTPFFGTAGTVTFSCDRLARPVRRAAGGRAGARRPANRHALEPGFSHLFEFGMRATGCRHAACPAFACLEEARDRNGIHQPAATRSRAVDRKFVRASAAARPPRWLGARPTFSCDTPLRRRISGARLVTGRR
jgi:hypothetical protein